MKPIIVIGQGGHSKVVQDIIALSQDYKLFAILDDKYRETWKSNGILYGPVSYAEEIAARKQIAVIIAIGDNRTRKKIASKLAGTGFEFAVLIHPTATVSPTAKIGCGTVVMARAVINSETHVGENAIINTGAIVEHDNRIEAYSHISPGAILTGNVQVGEGAHIMAGASVIPGKKVGSWSTVGAGAVVIHDLPGFVTAIGVPARIRAMQN
jgi:acetyltransferase EpsM